MSQHHNGHRKSHNKKVRINRARKRQSLVTTSAVLRLFIVMAATAYLFPANLSSAYLTDEEGSTQWEVVAPTGVDGVDPGASRGIKLVLKKDAKRGGSRQVQRSVVAEEPCEAAEEAPSVLPIARPHGKVPLPLILASGVAIDADHPLNFEIVDRVRPDPWCPSTIWIRRSKCFTVMFRRTLCYFGRRTVFASRRKSGRTSLRSFRSLCACCVFGVVL
ncbi:uncharacterized protein [Procambarus clarkii]|uniref:uncharacterized protein n=1 Tax=Procambarus clarkii TaxID=6728 RepID=UPI003743BBFF